MDSIIIITRYFPLFRKNESIVDDYNDLKSNANKVCTSNVSQSNTDDPIDSSKKPDERENVADIDDLCRVIDDSTEKISPNKESYRNNDDETKQNTMAPCVEVSETKKFVGLTTQTSLPFAECRASPISRSSSPIPESSPKDLSGGNKAIPPETSQSNPMDMSVLSNKISTIKSIDNFDACKYTHHTHTHTHNCSKCTTTT